MYRRMEEQVWSSGTVNLTEYFVRYLELLGALHNALSDFSFEMPVDPEYLSLLAEEDKEWANMSVSNIEEASQERALSSGRKASTSKSAAAGSTNSSGTDAKSNSRPYKLLREAIKKKINILLWCEYHLCGLYCIT